MTRYGNFTFLHRFIECNVPIESDSEKLKIGSSGVCESPVKTLRRCGIWKMNICFGEPQGRIKTAEEMFRHILSIAERMSDRNCSPVLLRIFIQIPGMKQLQRDSIPVQPFRKQFVQTNHGVSGCKTDIDLFAFCGLFGNHLIDFFGAQLAHRFIIFDFYPLHDILPFAFSCLYYTLKKRKTNTHFMQKNILLVHL